MFLPLQSYEHFLSRAHFASSSAQVRPHVGSISSYVLATHCRPSFCSSFITLHPYLFTEIIKSHIFISISTCICGLSSQQYDKQQELLCQDGPD